MFTYLSLIIVIYQHNYNIATSWKDGPYSVYLVIKKKKAVAKVKRSPSKPNKSKQQETAPAPEKVTKSKDSSIQGILAVYVSVYAAVYAAVY